MEEDELHGVRGHCCCLVTDVIREAKRQRKAVGGGWRQAGVLAAAGKCHACGSEVDGFRGAHRVLCPSVVGLHALEHHVGKLADDHANAQALALGLSQIPGQHTCATHPLLPLVIDCGVCTTGISCDPLMFKTNIVYFEVDGGLAQELVRCLKEQHNVLIGSKWPTLKTQSLE
jgi:hypothetical protein